jgi:hypothetical protein
MPLRAVSDDEISLSAQRHGRVAGRAQQPAALLASVFPAMRNNRIAE